MRFVEGQSNAKQSLRPAAVRRGKWSAVRWVYTVGCALIVVGILSLPASAHVRVFLGFGLPAYPYPYAYSYAPAPPCYAPYPPYIAYGAPPAAWVPGHWVWHHGPWGRQVRVWVPAHRH